MKMQISNWHKIQYRKFHEQLVLLLQWNLGEILGHRLLDLARHMQYIAMGKFHFLIGVFN